MEHSLWSVRFHFFECPISSAVDDRDVYERDYVYDVISIFGFERSLRTRMLPPSGSGGGSGHDPAPDRPILILRPAIPLAGPRCRWPMGPEPAGSIFFH